MGNHQWIVRMLKDIGSLTSALEIGAGDGELCRKLSKYHISMLGVDRMTFPADLPPRVTWLQADLPDCLSTLHADAAVGNMILHHFSDDELHHIGSHFSRFRFLCFCEPQRRKWAHALGKCISPFVDKITRHDLHASINAGFRKGELAELLGLQQWNIREETNLRGALRFFACRKQ